MWQEIENVTVMVDMQFMSQFCLKYRTNCHEILNQKIPHNVVQCLFQIWPYPSNYILQAPLKQARQDNDASDVLQRFKKWLKRKIVKERL